MDDFKLVVLRRYPAVIHAQLAQSALSGNDIQAIIQAGPHLKGEGNATFDLLVHPEDVVDALHILGPEETFSD